MARTIVAAFMLVALSTSATAALLSPETGSESGIDLSPGSTLHLANLKQAEPPIAVESGPAEQAAACALADQAQMKGPLEHLTPACPAQQKSSEADLDQVHLLDTTPVDDEPNLDPNELVESDGGLDLHLQALDLAGAVGEQGVLIDLRGLEIAFLPAAVDPNSPAALAYGASDDTGQAIHLASRRTGAADHADFGAAPAGDTAVSPNRGGGRAPIAMASAGAEPVGSGMLALALIVLAAFVLLCAAVSAGFHSPTGSSRRLKDDAGFQL